MCHTEHVNSFSSTRLPLLLLLLVASAMMACASVGRAVGRVESRKRDNCQLASPQFGGAVQAARVTKALVAQACS